MKNESFLLPEEIEQLADLRAETKRIMHRADIRAREKATTDRIRQRRELDQKMPAPEYGERF